MKSKDVGLMWVKMISLTIIMLAGAALIFYWGLGITFEDFWSQVALFIGAAAIGTIGVYIAFRTKTIFT